MGTKLFALGILEPDTRERVASELYELACDERLLDDQFAEILSHLKQKALVAVMSAWTEYIVYLGESSSEAFSRAHSVAVRCIAVVASPVRVSTSFAVHSWLLAVATMSAESDYAAHIRSALSHRQSIARLANEHVRGT